MKKRLFAYSAVVALITLLAAGFVACSDDDDSDDNTTMLVMAQQQQKKAEEQKKSAKVLAIVPYVSTTPTSNIPYIDNNNHIGGGSKVKTQAVIQLIQKRTPQYLNRTLYSLMTIPFKWELYSIQLVQIVYTL